jgi:hypothetical protein
MLPPNPDDLAGKTAAKQLVEHFHGTHFSALIGGAVEVDVRSRSWRSTADAPPPIPFPRAGAAQQLPLQTDILAGR